MTISNSLFFAILSMDSYDRTTNDIGQRGIDIGSGAVGNATPTVNSDQNLPRAANDGFFAQAYSWNNGSGQNIISYEGTNDTFADPFFGYGLALWRTLDEGALLKRGLCFFSAPQR